MNTPFSVVGLIPIVIFIVLLAFVLVRAVFPKRKIIQADHHHWIIRSLAALIAIAAIVATAIGTWRGTSMGDGYRPISVTVPTRVAKPWIKNKPSEFIDLGGEKIIGTVIVARRDGGRFIPLKSESQVRDLSAGLPLKMKFSGSWQSTSYEIGININRFASYGDGRLNPQGNSHIKLKGPGWSSSIGGSTHPIGMLNQYELGNGGGALQHAPLSLIPYDSGENTCMMFHLERADGDDPLVEAPAGEWLDRQSTAHFTRPSDNSRGGIRNDAPSPGIRMLGYLGPSAFLLLLASAAGSVCFRYGLRAPAFAGLVAAMVLYVGFLDALVLQRRANVMADPKKPESIRINALSAMSGTFFHAKRAQALADQYHKGKDRY